MNIARKLQAVVGLTAALALGFLASVPVQARGFFHPHQMRHAARLDRQARHAAYNGDYRRAARLRRQANHLRFAARHGY